MFDSKLNLSSLDPNGGFLCHSVHWQPNPNDPDPEMPGKKFSMISYIPVQPNDACLCSSGETYSNCCQPKRYWHPVCPNPDMKGYSLLVSQSALFHPVDGAALRDQLMEDSRLVCVEDSLEKGFWIYWGDPLLENQYGILCFGDLELKQNHTLLVTAMSDLRMQVLLQALKEITGNRLGAPQMSHDQAEVIDKWEKASIRRKNRKLRVERRK